MIIPADTGTAVTFPFIWASNQLTAFQAFTGNPLATIEDYYYFITTPSPQRRQYIATRPFFIRSVDDGIIIPQLD